MHAVGGNALRPPPDSRIRCESWAQVNLFLYNEKYYYLHFLE